MKNRKDHEFTIKKFSERTGIPCSTLRYYEQEKLLPSIKRGANGHRIYDEADLEWINIICCLKNTDMPIHEMREFVALSAEGDSTLQRRLNIVMAHRERVIAKIDELKDYLAHIDYKANYYTAACKLGSETEELKQQWYPNGGAAKVQEG